METPAGVQQGSGRPEGEHRPLVRPLPSKEKIQAVVKVPQPQVIPVTVLQPEVVRPEPVEAEAVQKPPKPKRKYRKRVEVPCVEPDVELPKGQRANKPWFQEGPAAPTCEADKRYIKKFDWKLDGTPITEILTEEGLDVLPKHYRSCLIREVPPYWRMKVGLTRAFNAETYPIGKPKGYIPASLAYTIVSILEPKSLLRLSKGLRPKEKGWETRKITAQLQRAAREYLSAGPRGIPQEINNRTDGPVVQRTEEIKVSYVVEVPPLMTPEDWEANARKALGGGDER